MSYVLLNNVRFLENFLAQHKFTIPELPWVVLVSPGDLERYIRHYIDDVVSQYSEWCPTTNLAGHFEDQVRMDLHNVGHAYQQSFEARFDEYFERFDQLVLAPIGEQVSQVMEMFGYDAVIKAIYLTDGTAMLENMGNAYEHNTHY